jgi:hypothetical protein
MPVRKGRIDQPFFLTIPRRWQAQPCERHGGRNYDLNTQTSRHRGAPRIQPARGLPGSTVGDRWGLPGEGRGGDRKTPLASGRTASIMSGHPAFSSWVAESQYSPRSKPVARGTTQHGLEPRKPADRARFGFREALQPASDLAAAVRCIADSGAEWICGASPSLRQFGVRPIAHRRERRNVDLHRQPRRQPATPRQRRSAPWRKLRTRRRSNDPQACAVRSITREHTRKNWKNRPVPPSHGLAGSLAPRQGADSPRDITASRSKSQFAYSKRNRRRNLSTDCVHCTTGFRQWR